MRRFKEFLGRHLTIEQIALAEAQVKIVRENGRMCKITKYEKLPGGIHIEEELSKDQQLHHTSIKDFDLNHDLMTKCTIFYKNNLVDVKVTTTYEPPGRIFGNTNVSMPSPYPP